MPDQNAAAALAVMFALALAGLLATALAVGASLRPAAAADPAPGCTEWTDGCVVCRRVPEGLACSTPGIACTRGAVQCLRR